MQCRTRAVLSRAKVPANNSIFIFIIFFAVFGNTESLQILGEHHDLEYTAVYVLCQLGDSGVEPQETVGASLAVTALSAQHNRSNLLLVMDTEPKPGIKKTLHVCVKPLYNRYGTVEFVVEWIQLHKLLGVLHFYLYNKSLSDRMSCALNHYQEQGLLTMMSWNLPLELWQEGQLAAFGDCLYRSMANAAWLMPVDTDEVVIPRRSDSLVAMLDLLTANRTGAAKPASFVFKNVFFSPYLEDHPEAPAALLTLRKTRRTVKPYPYKTRSKYIVHPPEAVELGIHYVAKHMPHRYSFNVSEEVALLHHYRECHDEMQVYSMVDRTVYKWADELSQKVVTELKQINNVCIVSAAPRSPNCFKFVPYLVMIFTNRVKMFLILSLHWF